MGPTGRHTVPRAARQDGATGRERTACSRVLRTSPPSQRTNRPATPLRSEPERCRSRLEVHRRTRAANTDVRARLEDRSACWSSPRCPASMRAPGSPGSEETDVLLVNGGDPLYLCHWMRESGLADLLPSLRETVCVGLSAGSMVMTPRIGEDFVGWKPPTGGDETLGLVDFSIFPHLDHEDLPENTMADAERWAAGHAGAELRDRRSDRHQGDRRRRRRRLRGALEAVPFLRCKRCSRSPVGWALRTRRFPRQISERSSASRARFDSCFLSAALTRGRKTERTPSFTSQVLPRLRSRRASVSMVNRFGLADSVTTDRSWKVP